MQTPTQDINAIETMLMNGLAFKTIIAAAHAKIFDTLEQPKTAAELAEDMGFKESPAKSMLNLLAANGIVEKSDDKFRNSRIASEFLVSSSKLNQLKSLELFKRFHEAISEDIIGLLKGEIETRSIIDKSWGQQDSMDGTAEHAILGAIQDTVAFITELPEFSSMKQMCDIGGNHGEFSMALLNANPGLSGEIADFPHVAETSNQRIAQRGFSNRLKAFGCDLRKDSLGHEKYDLSIASHILYAFTDNMEQILKSVYDSLKPGGWFVTHHLNESGNFDPRYIAGVQFVTNLSGYKTHTLNADRLAAAMKEAGFKTTKSREVGIGRTRLIVAAQKG
jgi:predicted transcriptional regulator